MKKPAVTSFLVAQKMMKKRIDKIEKLDLNFDQGSTNDGSVGRLLDRNLSFDSPWNKEVRSALIWPKWNSSYNKIFW